MKDYKKSFFMRLTLVDRTLIIIMCILMIQIALSLFLYGNSETYQSNEVDIAVRTTAAAVFGYFLSGNFTRDTKPKANCPLTVEMDKRRPNLSEEQVIIVSVFGISALIILIVVRDTLPYTPYVQSTVSQLRDFVSGCVGFLVGSPCKNKMN